MCYFLVICIFSVLTFLVPVKSLLLLLLLLLLGYVFYYNTHSMI
jgi:hypothetical protein